MSETFKRLGLQDDMRNSLFGLAGTKVKEALVATILGFILALPVDRRTVLFVSPHSDDCAIGAGALMHDLRRHGVRVVEMFMYSGHRVVGAAEELSVKERIELRTAEAKLADLLLGVEPVFLNLPSYDRPGYEPTTEEFDTVVVKTKEIRPGAVFFPPAKDRHAAHRASRALLSAGLLENELDIPLFSYASPWGGLDQVTHYHAYGATTAAIKDRALRAHVSQYEAHYPAFVYHRDRAPLSVLPQLTEGYYGHNGKAAASFAQAAGAELFCQLNYAPGSRLPEDPLLIVQGILRGYLPVDVLVAREREVAPRVKPTPVSRDVIQEEERHELMPIE
jgi:LmbE family N-acetylglucosaminyl deacetylase